VQFSEWSCSSWSEAVFTGARNYSTFGNDLAGGRVIESSRVSEEPQMKCDELEQIPELFPLCCDTGYGAS